MILEVELAYLAGLIDGEGTITLQPPRNKGFRSPQLSISSTDRELLVLPLRVFGGQIIHKHRRTQAHHKSAFEFRVRGQRAVGAIHLVLPYLRCPLKLLRANLVLDSYNLLTIRNGRYTAEQREAKIAFEREFFNLT